MDSLLHKYFGWKTLIKGCLHFSLTIHVYSLIKSVRGAGLLKKLIS